MTRPTLLAPAAAVLAAALLAAPACSRKKDEPRLAEAGPEDWVVDGAAYHITSTHYERRAPNVVVYVVGYPIPKGTSADSIDKDGAGILAWPIVKYAYNNKTFERAKAQLLGGSPPPQVMLAVDLLASAGGRVLFRHEVPAGK